MSFQRKKPSQLPRPEETPIYNGPRAPPEVLSRTNLDKHPQPTVDSLLRTRETATHLAHNQENQVQFLGPQPR